MSAGSDLTARFLEFHRENPHVYDTFVDQTRLWLRQTGADALGAQFLLERIRWVLGIRTRSADFKINNDYAAFYARLIMAREPDLKGVFKLRRSVADGVGWMELAA